MDGDLRQIMGVELYHDADYHLDIGELQRAFHPVAPIVENCPDRCRPGKRAVG